MLWSPWGLAYTPVWTPSVWVGFGLVPHVSYGFGPVITPFIALPFWATYAATQNYEVRALHNEMRALEQEIARLKRQNRQLAQQSPIVNPDANALAVQLRDIQQGLDHGDQRAASAKARHLTDRVQQYRHDLSDYQAAAKDVQALEDIALQLGNSEAEVQVKRMIQGATRKYLMGDPKWHQALDEAEGAVDQLR